MNGARRILLVALLAVALTVAAVSGVAYVAHHLWMGALAVGLLAAIAIFGSLSLWRERQRLGVLQLDLDADVPRSALWTERQARLGKLAKAGVRPDLEQLATAVRAAEAGRAFLGKYFVAVTVLVGLVGTFAGLMEMLRGVQPLLGATDAPGLDVLLRPLIGLDVTFGASVVGILVTLALTLLAGDLTLAEEAVLARLEERTAHELVPALWPPQAGVEQQILRLLSAWQATQEQAVGRLSEQLAGTIGKTFSHHTAQLVGTIEAQVGGAHQKTLQRLDETLEKAVHATLMRLDTMVARTLGELGNHLMTVVKSLDQSAGRTMTALSGATAEHLQALDRSIAKLLGELGTQVAALTTTHRTVVDAEEQRRHASQHAAQEAFLAAATALQPLLVAFGDAARALSVETGKLTPELASLSQEIALLAARSETTATPLVLDELARLAGNIAELQGDRSGDPQ